MVNWADPHYLEFYVNAGKYTSYAKDIAGYIKSSVPSSHHVMDIGSGPGIVTKLLTGYFARLTAVEPSPHALTHLSENSSDIELINSTLEKLPDKSCDTSIAVSFGRTTEQLEKIISVARVKAILVCSVKSDVLPVTRGKTSRLITQAEYLERKGVPFRKTEILSEFGQPFRNIDEILTFRRQHKLESLPLKDWMEKNVVLSKDSPLPENIRKEFPLFMKNAKVLHILDITVS